VQVQCSTSTSTVSVRLQFAVYAFIFVGAGDLVCPATELDLVPRVWIESHVWCVMFACSFCRFVQAALEPAGREKWHTAPLCMAGHRETFHGLGVQDVVEFDSD
jgi:hypothetical protein